MNIHTTSRTEIIDIIKAWIAISIAFAIVRTGFSFSATFFMSIALAAVTVGVGFLAHELAHKIVAQRYGCRAEFRADDRMLLLAVGFAVVFRLIFAAPGAVVIDGVVTRKENGFISVVGSWMNIIIAALFLGLTFVLPSLNVVWTYGHQVNAWLALFNMIPFWILDGKKVFAWNKTVWVGTVLAAFGLLFV